MPPATIAGPIQIKLSRVGPDNSNKSAIESLKTNPNSPKTEAIVTLNMIPVMALLRASSSLSGSGNVSSVRKVDNTIKGNRMALKKAT